ncbi:hypothetical protein FMEAI12_4280065 [Parafrankia sp. Ea1.12]|nr:hypothetical protein FMEAI12_4280065 [Parafrankia sp. Ea1.12]
MVPGGPCHPPWLLADQSHRCPRGSAGVDGHLSAAPHQIFHTQRSLRKDYLFHLGPVTRQHPGGKRCQLIRNYRRHRITHLTIQIFPAAPSKFVGPRKSLQDS